MEKPELLIVDDESINIAVLGNTLGDAYRIRACKTGAQALLAVHKLPRPDLILLDILMPGMDGYETLSRLRADPVTMDIPVIFITALDNAVDEAHGFALGAVDYITKPFRPAVVQARIRAHLELKQARDWLSNKNVWLASEVAHRVQENELIQDATLAVITQLAETRDTDTGNHILRTSAYVEILARKLQQNPKHADYLEERTLSLIVKAAPLHDIGKIGIRDAILLKPGKLDEEEFRIMQTHCRIGGDAIRSAMNQTLTRFAAPPDEAGPTALNFLEIAEHIALNHHEKWNGSGYPGGLSGEDIPLCARIMALADVFDAMTTPRVYKSEMHVAEAAAYIQEQGGRHFDPDVVSAFEAELTAFTNVHRLMADEYTGRLV